MNKKRLLQLTSICAGALLLSAPAFAGGEGYEAKDDAGLTEQNEQFGVSPQFEEDQGLEREEGLSPDGARGIYEEGETPFREQEEFGASPGFQTDEEGSLQRDEGVIQGEGLTEEQGEFGSEEGMLDEQEEFGASPGFNQDEEGFIEQDEGALQEEGQMGAEEEDLGIRRY